MNPLKVLLGSFKIQMTEPLSLAMTPGDKLDVDSVDLYVLALRPSYRRLVKYDFEVSLEIRADKARDRKIIRV